MPDLYAPDPDLYAPTDDDERLQELLESLGYNRRRDMFMPVMGDPRAPGGTPTFTGEPIDMSAQPVATAPIERLVGSPTLAQRDERFPAGQKYREALSAEPKPYKPSLGRRIAGMAAAFAGGYVNPQLGFQAGQNILYRPAMEQQQKEKRNLERLHLAAQEEQNLAELGEKLERGDRERQLFALDKKIKQAELDKLISPEEAANRRAAMLEKFAPDLPKEIKDVYVVSGDATVLRPHYPKEDTSKSELDRLIELYGPEKGLDQYQRRQVERSTAGARLKAEAPPNPRMKVAIEARKRADYRRMEEQARKQISDLEKQYQYDPNTGTYKDRSKRFGPSLANQDYLRMRQDIWDNLEAQKEQIDLSYKEQMAGAGFDVGGGAGGAGGRPERKPTAKNTASRAEVEEFAKEKKITYQQAVRLLQEAGYTIR